MINKQLTPDGEDTPRFSDKQTDKRIHEVLTNEKDEVSEEDINNIRTDVEATDLVSPPRNIDPSDKNSAEHKEVRDDSDPRIENDSWNILEGNDAG